MPSFQGSIIVGKDSAGRRLRRAALRSARAVGLEKPARAAAGRRRSSQAARSAKSDEARRWAVTKHQVQTATAGDGPIVVGPWLSELGFEVLYWVPFLRWLTARFEIDPERLHVVSRGGTASWYAGIANHYVEIFDHFTPQEFREHTEARWQAVGGQKQMDVTKWDKQVLNRMGDAIDWNKHSLLHPSLMYHLFRNFWKGAAPLHHILNHTRVARLHPPEGDEWLERLPSGDFVAVKFYFRPSFPDLPINRRAVRQAVAQIARHTDVVVLNTGLEIDDHTDVDPGVEERVTWMLRDVPPSLNLHVQSLAISRAKAFVGTYGGLSYLAPMYGVRSMAYYSEPEHFLPSHLDFARRAAYSTGGSLMTVSTKHSQLFELLGDGGRDHVA